MRYSDYRTPDGSIVKIDETVAKGAPALTFETTVPAGQPRRFVMITRVATLEQWLAAESLARKNGEAL